jgi:hypothetical protein
MDEHKYIGSDRQANSQINRQTDNKYRSIKRQIDNGPGGWMNTNI